MDLGSSTTNSPVGGRSAMLLTAIAEHTETIRSEEAERLLRIVEWAEENTVDSVDDGAATIRDSYVDTGLPIAGDGAPLISEFAIVELSATLGRSTGSGREYVGKIVELAYRLPLHWGQVQAGKLEPWRGLAIADKTHHLPEAAAAYVDHHLHAFAATCTWAQMDRLVEEALVLFDPEAAEEKARQAAEGRFFDTGVNQTTTESIVYVSGGLDLPDALDLEATVSDLARQLGDLGCQDPLDVRRAKAVGELARGQQPLDLTPANLDEQPVPRPRVGRSVSLIVHLSEDAIAGHARVATCGNTRTRHPLMAVERWISEAGPGAKVTVKPVRDLAAHDPVEGYAVRDRQKDQVELRDETCAFAHCDRPAHGCDADHAVPYGQGGVTCPCNLVPLCRRHHRAKTFSAWNYVVLFPSCYLWTSPSGRQYLVDAHGTRDLSRQSTCPARPYGSTPADPVEPPDQ